MSEANCKLIGDIPRITHINLHNEYSNSLSDFFHDIISVFVNFSAFVFALA